MLRAGLAVVAVLQVLVLPSNTAMTISDDAGPSAVALDIDLEEMVFATATRLATRDSETCSYT